ncbi:MAG: hypothetical protein JWM90_2934, partial [Thermoleophilia bacterium]|nr:hypothetical protein [Thermoleophilia bacterium]
MASIPTTPNTSPATNPQLAGILNMAPVPGPVNAVLPNGAPTPHAPASSVTVGGNGGNSFTVQLGDATSGGGVTPATNGGGLVVVGGGTAPAAGAQPAAPGAAAPTAPTAPTAGTVPTAPAPAVAGTPTVVPGVTAAPTAATTIVPKPTDGSAALPISAAGTTVGSTGTGTDGVVGVAVAKSGFGKAERGKPMQASVDGANFGFPSFKASAKDSKAPKVTWGPGWTKVKKDGMYYMQHTNGTKAIPAVEYRITPTPADKLQSVKVANGWGKKFPDGSIVVFDRTEGPYRLDAKGAKHKLGLGNQTIGGVKVRIFEASVVRTLEKNGAVTVFDSRGQNKAGSPRGVAAAVAGAGAGAALVAGGPSSSKGGGVAKTEADLTGDVQKLTGIARGLLNQIRSGNLDQAELASLQAQLSALPAGILQAAGAAGATLPPLTTTTTAGGTTVAGAGTAPVAGADANTATSKLAAGAKGTLEAPVPAELVGKQARFGQLPEAVQVSIAKAYGSTQGVAALEADA